MFKRNIPPTTSQVEPLAPSAPEGTGPANDVNGDLNFEVASRDIEHSTQEQAYQPATHVTDQAIDEKHVELADRMITHLVEEEGKLEERIKADLDTLRRTQNVRRGYEALARTVTTPDKFERNNPLAKEMKAVLADGAGVAAHTTEGQE